MSDEIVGTREYYGFLIESTKQMSDQQAKAMVVAPGAVLGLSAFMAKVTQPGGLALAIFGVSWALLTVCFVAHIWSLHTAQQANLIMSEHINRVDVGYDIARRYYWVTDKLNVAALLAFSGGLLATVVAMWAAL